MATYAPTKPAFVTMQPGLVVSVPALQLLWRLEDAGMVVRIDDQTGRLLVGPTARLTTDDDRAIRVHRDELIELVKICDEMVV